jgi:hypothetical protein
MLLRSYRLQTVPIQDHATAKDLLPYSVPRIKNAASVLLAQDVVHMALTMIRPIVPNRRPPAELAREFPLLYELSTNLGLAIPSIYTKSDLQSLFARSEKSIRRWMDAGLLPNRRLPN